MVRPISGRTGPASSTSSESRAVTLSPTAARTDAMVLSERALATARPTARRSSTPWSFAEAAVSVAVGSAASPDATRRPSSRSRTQAAVTPVSATRACGESSEGSASASSQARAARYAASASASDGREDAAAGVFGGVAAAAGPGGVAADAEMQHMASAAAKAFAARECKRNLRFAWRAARTGGILPPDCTGVSSRCFGTSRKN